MLTAQQARAQINLENSCTLKAIEKTIETAINNAIVDLKTSVKVSLSKKLEEIGQKQIIDKMKSLGYAIKYEDYYGTQWDPSNDHYFHISW